MSSISPINLSNVFASLSDSGSDHEVCSPLPEGFDQLELLSTSSAAAYMTSTSSGSGSDSENTTNVTAQIAKAAASCFTHSPAKRAYVDALEISTPLKSNSKRPKFIADMAPPSPSDSNFLRRQKTIRDPGRPVQQRFRMLDGPSPSSDAIVNRFSPILTRPDSPGEFFMHINGAVFASPKQVMQVAQGMNHKVWRVLGSGTISLLADPSRGVSACTVPISQILLKKPYMNPALSSWRRGGETYEDISRDEIMAHQYYEKMEGKLNALGIYLAKVYCKPIPEDGEDACSVVQFIPNDVKVDGWKDSSQGYGQLPVRDQETLRVVKNVLAASVEQRSILIDDFYSRNVKLGDDGKVYLIDFSPVKPSLDHYGDLLRILPSLLIAWANGNSQIYEWFMEEWPADVQGAVNGFIDPIRQAIGHFPTSDEALAYEGQLENVRLSLG